MDKAQLAQLYGAEPKGDFNKIRMNNPCIKEWVARLRRKDQVEKSTVKNFISQLGTTLEATAAGKKSSLIDEQFIRSITMDDLKNYWDNVLLNSENPVSGSKRRVKLAVWNSFFINSLGNVWNLEREFEVKREKKQRVSMNSDEMQDFLNVIKDPTDDIYFSLILGSGLREEEAKFQNKNNIDEKSMKVYVRITKLFSPKNKKERDTVLPQRLLTSIKNYQRPDACEEKWEPLLLLNKKGKPLCLTTMRRRFIKYCKIAKIDKKLSMHKLRSTFTSLLVRSGYPMEVVHVLLGHGTMETTRKWYVDLENEVNIDNTRSPLDTYLPQ